MHDGDGEEPEEPWLEPTDEPGVWGFDGGIVIGDELAERMLAPPDPPTQAALDSLCVGATRVVVVDIREWFEVEPDVYRPSPELVADVHDGPVIDRLRTSLRIDEHGAWGRAMSDGDLVLEFFRGTEHRGSVTVHDAERISWTPLLDVALLVDAEPFLGWLDEHGAPFVRQAFEEERAEAERAHAEADRWFAAMPACLAPHREAMLASDWQFDWTRAGADLSRAYPDPVLAARSVFEWFGSRGGPWSGMPVYETVPEWYLLSVPLDVLVRAATSEPVNDQLTEGAARFFGGWWFNTRRPDDRELLPDDLRRRLLAHTIRSDDEDKRKRAFQAFS